MLTNLCILVTKAEEMEAEVFLLYICWIFVIDVKDCKCKP